MCINELVGSHDLQKMLVVSQSCGTRSRGEGRAAPGRGTGEQCTKAGHVLVRDEQRNLTGMVIQAWLKTTWLYFVSIALFPGLVKLDNLLALHRGLGHHEGGEAPSRHSQGSLARRSWES